MGSLVAQLVKNLPTLRETWVQFLGWEDPLEKGKVPIPVFWPGEFHKVKVIVIQSCLTLCDPMDYAVHGILQARILEWVAVPFSRGSSQPWDQTQVSHIAGRFFTS